MTTQQAFAVTVPNRAPEATGAAVDSVRKAGGAARDVNLADWFSDPDGDSLAYVAVSTDTAVFSMELASGAVILVAARTGAHKIVPRFCQP